MSTLKFPPDNPGTLSGGGVGTVPDSSLPGTFILQQASGSYNLSPAVQTCAGAADAVTFANAVNIAIFTSTTDTGANAATLAVPGASDVGKVLIIINTNTTQNVINTTAGKFLIGTATAYGTLTAPAHAGAVVVLIASNGFWNVLVLGTGTWVLS